jgi:ketosteroid isomerase-like protein
MPAIRHPHRCAMRPDAFRNTAGGQTVLDQWFLECLQAIHMSRIYEQLKTLETRIRHDKPVRAPQQSAPAQTDARTVGDAPPAGKAGARQDAPSRRGGLRRKHYLGAVLFAMIAGLALVGRQRPASEPERHVVLPPPPTVAAASQVVVAAAPQPDDAANVRQDIQQWADAWSRRDTAAYLAAYADDFAVPDGMSRAAWEAQRKSRLRRYRSIAVILSDIEISFNGADQADAVFTQDFLADSYREMEARKALHLRKADGRWLIVSEQVGGS